MLGNKCRKKMCLDIVAVIIIVISSVFLSSCRNMDKETNQSLRQNPSQTTQEVLETTEKESVSDEKAKRHTAGGISFDLNPGWKKIWGTDCFWNKEKTDVYGLNASSPLGQFTPEECFSLLAEYYKDTDSYLLLDQSDELTQWYSGEGVLCYLGTITGELEDGYSHTEIVIVPQKNLVLTLVGQTSFIDEDKESVLKMNVTNLRESLKFETGVSDYVSGNTYLLDDGSELCLLEDGGFTYYRKEENHENQYLTGTYETFYGQSAFDQVTSMTEYGFEKEELEQLMSANMNGYIPGGSKPLDYLYATDPDMTDTRPRYQICKDTFYAVILHNTKFVNGEGEEEEIEKDTLYIGYYIPELNIVDMTNCSAASHATWTFKGKTE